MKIAAIALLALPVFSQTIPVGLTVPDRMTLQVNLSGSTANNPAVLFVDIAIPSGMVASPVTQLVPNSTTKCESLTGSIRCVVLSFSGEPTNGLPGSAISRLSPGAMLRIGVHNPTGLRCMPVAKIRSVQGASPDISLVPMSFSDISMPLDPNPQSDLNGDGQVTVVDLDVAIQRLLSGSGVSILQLLQVASYIGVGDCPLP